MHDARSLLIEVAGQPLYLCAERAAFEPVSGSLLIADAHFGKGATFRARGVPVPSGTTDDNLLRLDALIARHAPRAIVFLGDLLHAREAQAGGTTAALSAWRERHPALQLTLVVGNHDRHAGSPAPALRIASVAEPWRLSGWALCHHPQHVAGAYALAGHEHPGIRLASRVDAVRVPCFRFGATLGVLPAFGAFTGLALGAHAGQRIFAVTEQRVIALPPERGG